MLTSTNIDNYLYFYEDVYPRIAFNIRKITTGCFESLMPSNVYMDKWTWSSLVKQLARSLFGDTPLTKPIPGYFQMDHWKDITVKFESKYETFY